MRGGPPMRDAMPDGRAGGPGLLHRDELPTKTVSANLGGRTASSELNFRYVFVGAEC